MSRQRPVGGILATGNDCPIDGCEGHRQRSHHVMCRRCWSLIHLTLQRHVWAALGERNRVARGRPTREQLRRAVDAYEEWRARAIAAAERASRRRAAA